MQRRVYVCILIFTLMTGFLSLSYAQTVEEVLTRVYPVPSPTGSEHLMAGKIMQVLPREPFRSDG